MEPGEELERLRAALLSYCQLDTLAMGRILEKLSALAAAADAPAGRGKGLAEIRSGLT